MVRWPAGLNAITLDAAALLTSTFGIAIVRAALPAFVARRYGYDVFGQLAAALAVAQAVALFGELGISEWVLYAARKNNLSRPSGRQMMLMGAVGFVVGAIAGGIVWIFTAKRGGSWFTLVPPLLFLNVLYAAEFVAQALLRAEFRVRTASLIRLVQVSANLVFLIVAFRMAAELTAVLWLLGAIEVVVLGMFVRAVQSRTSSRTDEAPALKTVFSEYFRFALSAIAAYAYISSDAFLLALFRVPQEVGDYTAAYRLYVFAVQIVAVFAGVMVPLLYGTADSRNKSNLFETASRTQLSIAIFSAALLILTAPLMIKLYVGPQFRTSVVVLSFLSVSVFIKGAGYIPAGILVASGYQQSRMKVQVLVACVNVALNLILIPMWGLWAALATTLASDALLVACYVVVVTQRVGGRVNGKDHYAKYAAVTAALLASAASVSAAPLVSKLLAGATIFVVVLHAVRQWRSTRELFEEFGRASAVSRPKVASITT